MLVSCHFCIMQFGLADMYFDIDKIWPDESALENSFVYFLLKYSGNIGSLIGIGISTLLIR
jgi:hypothetical protein